MEFKNQTVAYDWRRHVATPHLMHITWAKRTRCNEVVKRSLTKLKVQGSNPDWGGW